MILAIIAAAYRAGQELGGLPKDVVLFPFLVLGAWILFLYWVFAGPRAVRRYNKAYKAWAREKRTVAYSIAILVGAIIGGATGAGWWKLFEVHRKQMARLKDNPIEKTPPSADISKDLPHGTADTAEAKPKKIEAPKDKAASQDLRELVNELKKEHKKPCRTENSQLVDCSDVEVLAWGKPVLERLNAAIQNAENAAIRRHKQYEVDHDEAALNYRVPENIMLNRFLESDYKNFVTYREAVVSHLKGGDPSGYNSLDSLTAMANTTGGRLVLADKDTWLNMAQAVFEDLQGLSYRLEQQTSATVNAPNGIAIGHDNLGTAIVNNNYSPPSRVLSVDSLHKFKSVLASGTSGIANVRKAGTSDDIDPLVQQLNNALREARWGGIRDGTMYANGVEPLAEGIECYSANWESPESATIKRALEASGLRCKYFAKQYSSGGATFGGITILVGRH